MSVDLQGTKAIAPLTGERAAYRGIRVIIATSLLFSAALRAAVAPAEWKFQQSLSLNETGLVRVALPPATLDRVLPDVADLRLLNPSGQEVPYAIEIPSAPALTRTTPKHFRAELQRLATQLTIETGVSGPLEGLELATPIPTFVKAARLEVSSDGEQWELIGDGLQLARGRQLEQTFLPLNKLRAAFVRVTLDDWRTSVVPFTGATLLVAPTAENPTIAVATELSKREEFAHETVLTIDLQARNLPLAEITFDTPEPLFARSVSVTQRRFIDGESSEQILAAGMIFRSRAAGLNPRERLTIPVNVTAGTRELLVHIQNDDNPPIALAQVQVRRRPVWLMFHAAAAGNYRVLTGNRHAAAPRYDLSVLREDLRSAHESTAEPGAPQPNPGYSAPDALADAPLLGTALDVANWKYHRVVTPAAAGVQELELDPEILSRAQPGLGDLRLMRDGRQAPYLIERTSLHRTLSFEPTPDDDPKTPRLSRWKIKLPWAHLPLTRVTLVSSTALFSRQIQVYEMISSERGDTWRSSLAAPQLWNVAPGRRNAALAISLQATSQSNALFIETDNGDNPPIVLTAAQFDYPVVHLLFRSDAQPLELYYGNDEARAPSYDLQLVAPQLLNEEKNSAKLSAPEAPKSEGPLFKYIKGGALLWSSLALVVASLLFAIARLLPKPPAPPS
jgi:hypothetical protein